MALSEQRRQLLQEEATLIERNNELLLMKAREDAKDAPLDVAENILGEAYKTAGQPLVPQEGIGKEVTEAALKGAGAIIPGGRAAAEPFLKDPATRTVMGLGAGLATAPAATLGAVGGGLVGGMVAPEGRENIGTTVGGLLGGGIGAGAGAVGKNIAAKSAGGVINSMIKPKGKAFQYGKNPGQEVAKQNITGNSLPQLAKNIGKRTSELYSQVKAMITPKKTIDLQPIVDPIHEELTALKMNPNTNKAAIAKLEGLVSDIMGIKRVGGKIVSKRALGKVPGDKALKMKQSIGKIAKWTGKDAPPSFEAVVHQVYHAIDVAMEGAFPGMKALNRSIANLIGAEKAIPAAIAAAEKAPAGGLLSLKTGIGAGLGAAATGGTPAGALLGVGASKALAHPATGSRIASGLAKIGKLK